MDITNIQFKDNSAVQNDKARYLDVEVNVKNVLESWRDSIFSFEWLDGDGQIKSPDDIAKHEQPKRKRVEDSIAANKSLEKPILGIGLKDNVEIGSGRAEFLTLAAHGIKTIPVHIPKSNESDFKDFLADVD